MSMDLRIQQRIEKLLRLAESPEPHEAAAARQKVEELRRLYGPEKPRRLLPTPPRPPRPPPPRPPPSPFPMDDEDDGEVAEGRWRKVGGECEWAVVGDGPLPKVGDPIRVHLASGAVRLYLVRSVLWDNISYWAVTVHKRAY
jgi:hypothetical protein